MTLNEFFLVIAAILPTLVLCIYVYKHDRADKEPMRLLALLFLAGVFLCFPAAKLEGLLLDETERFFYAFAISEADGSYVLSDGMHKVYLAVRNLICIGLVEEGLKFAVTFLITHKNKNFNSLFDGIIYAVFVSLGFATLENILYVLRYGWMNALMRGVLSVPGHMFYAVIMGYYYSWWHIYKKADENENEFKKMNIIFDGGRIRCGRFIALAIAVPTILHGIYDYCCSVNTVMGTVLIYLLVIGLYFYCFDKIRNMSRLDTSSIRISARVLLLTHPTLVEVLEEKGIPTAELTDDSAIQAIIKDFEN